MLKIIASLPGESQDKRIAFMMQCPESPALNIDHGSGLLMAAHAFHTARPNQPYSSEINYAFDRYVYVLKELLHLTPIVKWLQDNRQIWLFMERELLESQHHGTSANGQARGTYSGREVDATSVPLDHHHSDSDMAGINDSDDEDDDSRFEDIGTLHEAPQEIVVEGAGAAVVNGLYYKDGYFENACKYSMQGKYQGKPCTFSLFQCNVSNNTKHWYISIVPRNSQPGTSTDIDFYSAPVLDNCLEYPPQNTWTKSNEGRDPPPRLNFKESASPRQLDPQDPMISPRHPGSGLDDANHGTQPYI